MTLAIIVIVVVLIIGGVAGGVYFTKDDFFSDPLDSASVDSAAIDITTGPGIKEVGDGREAPKNNGSIKIETKVETIIDYKGPSAEEFFRKMRLGFDATKNFAELEAFNLKYASHKHAEEIIKARTAYGTLSPEILENLFKVAKTNLPASREITSVNGIVTSPITASAATPTTANLKISTSKNSLEGTVILVLENGEWKLDSEAWAKITI